MADSLLENFCASDAVAVAASNLGPPLRHAPRCEASNAVSRPLHFRRDNQRTGSPQSVTPPTVVLVRDRMLLGKNKPRREFRRFLRCIT